jgi:hypothetical protein
MDPVARQFLEQLDAAEGELPASVTAGLMMCGSDAVPGLVERLAPDGPVPLQVHAAQVLGKIRDPDALVPLVHAFARGPVSVEVTRALGGAIRAYGPAFHEVALGAAATEAYPPAGRLALVGMVMMTGGDDPVIDELIATLTPKAPDVGLVLMRERPRVRWMEVIRAHRDLFRAAEPELTAAVSLQVLPLLEGARAERMAQVHAKLAEQQDYAAEVLKRLAKNTDDA